MVIVFDQDGNELAEMPLSENQLAAIERGPIGVLYHTPRMLQGSLGQNSGSFMLHKDGERIVAPDPAAFRKYVDLQKAIAAARES